jgi:hypothetical protein
MREIRQSGSEGGGAETNRLSLPLLLGAAAPFSVGRIESTPTFLDPTIEEAFLVSQRRLYSHRD